MWNDLRFGLRMLQRSPAFTLTAVVTLALGLSVNVTVFSLVSSLFFQPLPVKDGRDLAMILQRSATWQFPHGHSYPDYLDYRSGVETFTDLIAYFPSPVHLSYEGQQPERTWIELVSGNFFELLGVEATFGQVFNLPPDNRVGDDALIVLDHQYWQRRFGGDRTVVGRTVTLNGHPFIIVGVAPREFQGAEWALGVTGYVPVTVTGRIIQGGAEMLENRGVPAFKIMGRLKPDVTLTQARAAVSVVAAQLHRQYPAEHKDASVMVVAEMRARPDPTFADYMPLASGVFMGLVALVLLIACANVANLMISRAVVRQKEMGVRVALGASRWRLIRQLLVESVLLALLAGAVGILLAHWAGGLLAGFQPSGDLPVRSDKPWDWRVFAFSGVVTILAGVVTGLAPALRATRLNVQRTLKEGGAALLASGRHHFRNLLVVSQVAICLVVLVCGGLFLQSLRQLVQLDLGFRPERLLLASFDLGRQGYDVDRGQRFQSELLERVRALPGVDSASLALVLPFGYGVQMCEVAPEGRIGVNGEGFTVVPQNYVGPDYLRTMGIGLQRGRSFTDQDNVSRPRVAVINALMAERLWPGQEPLGKRFQLNRDGPLVEVMGVVPTAKYVMLGEEPKPYCYLPLAQHYLSSVTLHVRARGLPASLLPAVREVFAGLDPHLPVYDVRTMDEHLRQSVFAFLPLRMGATMAAVQGLLALGLAVMGLYGVVSYVSTQRTREIGIRMALGASRRDIRQLVVRDGWKLTRVGMIVGLVMALLLSQGLSRLLYGLNPLNPLVYAAVLLLLGGVAWLACYVPARRATRVDPMTALRCE
jgi:predicted permease